MSEAVQTQFLPRRAGAPFESHVVLTESLPASLGRDTEQRGACDANSLAV